jgi:hypothetical protein
MVLFYVAYFTSNVKINIIRMQVTFLCVTICVYSRLRLKCDGTRRRTGGEVKGKTVQFLPYGRSIGSWLCLTHKTYTCHTVQCCACRLYFFFERVTMYNNAKRNTRKAATVHLNCSTVPCNTLCVRITAAVPCNTLCARIPAAVWRKTRDVICYCECKCECATLGCSTLV